MNRRTNALFAVSTLLLFLVPPIGAPLALYTWGRAVRETLR